METVKRLGGALALTFVFSAAALADGTPLPPCNPGETHGPPCSSAQPTSDDLMITGETQSPPAADTVDVTYVLEATLTALLIL